MQMCAHLKAHACRYVHSDVETLKETKRPLWGTPSLSERRKSEMGRTPSSYSSRRGRKEGRG